MTMRAADFFVLRAMARRGGFGAADVADVGGDGLAALRRWRDDYGAVREVAGGGWKLCYLPQWIGDAVLQVGGVGDVVVVGQTASTNDDAAGLTAAAPVVVFAEHQTAGRGRRGRLWLSLPGGAVLFSVHLLMPHAKAAGLTVAVGVGLWRVLKQYADIKLKWPNDLLDGHGRKVGGVLAEAKGNSVVVGVGINWYLTARMAERIGQPAAGLCDSATGLPPIAELSQMLAGVVVQTCAQFVTDGLYSFLADALRAHYVQVGDEITLTDVGGADDKKHSGVFAGFDDDGALLLTNGGGVVRCVFGELQNVACG